jgi:hypothetical protein
MIWTIDDLTRDGAKTTVARMTVARTTGAPTIGAMNVAWRIGAIYPSVLVFKLVDRQQIDGHETVRPKVPSVIEIWRHHLLHQHPQERVRTTLAEATTRLVPRRAEGAAAAAVVVPMLCQPPSAAITTTRAGNVHGQHLQWSKGKIVTSPGPLHPISARGTRPKSNPLHRRRMAVAVADDKRESLILEGVVDKL